MSELVVGWVQKNIGNLVTFKKGKKVETSDELLDGYLRYLGASGLEGKDDGYGLSDNGVIANKTDVLMLWDGERSGLVGHKQFGVVSSTVSRLRPETELIDPTFLYYSLLLNFNWIQQNRTGTGVPHVPKDLGRILNICYPIDIEIQQKIAKILSTVDNLIEKTQTLIDKYTTIKQGMMADLFTRGIDMTTSDTSNPKGGKLRPSVEDAPELYKQTELGWVPKEWEVKNLGELAEKVTSGSRDWAAYYADEGDLFVRISNLTREHINFRWKSIRYVDIGNGSEGERTRLAEGDILISITADLGIIGVVPNDFGRAFINQHTALVRLTKEIVNPRFIGNFLHSHAGQFQFEKFNDSGAKAGLNLPTVASLNCLLPSLEEQDLISVRVDSVDTQIEIYKIELAKYQSQKKGLMQDLLTGSVRVN